MGELGHGSWWYEAELDHLFPLHSQRNTRTQGMDHQRAKPTDGPRFLCTGCWHQCLRYFLNRCMEKQIIGYHIYLPLFISLQRILRLPIPEIPECSTNRAYNLLTTRTTVDGHPQSERY